MLKCKMLPDTVDSTQIHIFAPTSVWNMLVYTKTFPIITEYKQWL